MTHPANSGWQGGAPIILINEDGRYRDPLLGSISSTAFNFEENFAKPWIIKNLSNKKIHFKFYALSKGSVDACRIKPAKGDLEPGQQTQGTVTAKNVVKNIPAMGDETPVL